MSAVSGAYRRPRAIAQGALASALLIWGTGRAIGVSWSAFMEESAVAPAMQMAAGLLRPALGVEFVGRTLQLLTESVAIAGAGMALALLLGVPLALAAIRLPRLEAAADREAWWERGARGTARGVLALLRSVPEIVWAYLFVRIFGLGPLPAVFAIGLSFAGIVGKLFAELAEAVDPVPVRALRAAGASRAGALVFGVWPQARLAWSGYALFRLECAVRSAAILGVVGAGGLGAEIELSVRYLQFDRLATVLLALLGSLALLEAWSAWVRDKRRYDLATLALMGVAGAMSLAGKVTLAPSVLESAAAFLRGFARPTTAVVTSPETLRLLGETLAMAAWATLVAAVIAATLAPWASGRLTRRGFLPHAATQRNVGRGVVMALVRGVLLVLRSVPDLVFALLAVLWVGPGPLAGALAVAAHTIGTLGRLFAESYDDLDVDACRLLQAQGASNFTIWIYGLLPPAAPRLLAHIFFRFEVNVRATTMVGFVGAGGLGDAIHTAISLFRMGDLAALLLLLIATVVILDAIGAHLRRRLLAG
ncbi:MAG: ABC transporter permease subunit [Myxococcota bacterium]